MRNEVPCHKDVHLAAQ